MQDRMREGRIRYGYRYYGAHTGRWSGEGVQMQNLPRCPSQWGEAQINLRICFQAPKGYKFVVADLSSIETLVLAWLTRCEPLLSVFERGEDPYIDFAATWFGQPYPEITRQERQLAKPAVLGCGYGLGGGELKMSCCGKLSDSDRADVSQPFCICKKRGDEFKSGLWGYSEKIGAPLTHDHAHGAVRAYRAKYWPVTNFWRGVENIAIEAAIAGVARSYFGIVFGAVPQKFLWVKLPSGRRLHYLSPQVRHGKPGLELTHESYGLRGWQRQKLYGGLLTENLVQSVSRDILAEGMLRADADGLTIVGHTHDEIICLEPDDASSALDRLIAQRVRALPEKQKAYAHHSSAIRMR